MSAVEASTPLLCSLTVAIHFKINGTYIVVYCGLHWVCLDVFGLSGIVYGLHAVL